MSKPNSARNSINRILLPLTVLFNVKTAEFLNLRSMDCPHLNNIQRTLSAELSLFIHGEQAEQGPMEIEATKAMVTLSLCQITTTAIY